MRTMELGVCDAPSLAAAVTCMVDTAAVRTPLCMKNNFMHTINDECVQEAAARRLSEGEGELVEDDSLEGSEAYLHRIGRLSGGRSSGATRTSTMTTLGDGTKAVDISTLSAAQRGQIADLIGVQALAGGRLLFNTSDDAPVQRTDVLLEAMEDDATTHSRRLSMEMKCDAPGVGPGCLFAIGYPWGCNPMGSDCTFGIGIKVQIGGPYDGALTIYGAGCIEEWAFSVPPPFSGEICIEGGLTMTQTPTCGLNFGLAGFVAIEAVVGLNLVIFTFSAASVRLEIGAAIENYKYNCDTRRRRRRRVHRRRGKEQTCDTACDIKVYAKATLQILVGRVWALAQYYVRNKDFDFIIGADVHVFLLFTSYWENVAQVQIV
eukprot:SRR837773.18421.p1 GENE.SRR837773.18421~~SRR837773.18421.p1  ORF type:complete len:376 (-),score=95.99 SRR837773.18421:74-1201(-)